MVWIYLLLNAIAVIYVIDLFLSSAKTEKVDFKKTISKVGDFLNKVREYFVNKTKKIPLSKLKDKIKDSIPSSKSLPGEVKPKKEKKAEGYKEPISKVDSKTSVEEVELSDSEAVPDISYAPLQKVPSETKQTYIHHLEVSLPESVQKGQYPYKDQQERFLSEEVSFRDSLEILLRRKLFITFFFIATVFTAVVVTKLMPSIYQASSLILVEVPEKVIVRPDFEPAISKWSQTGARIIKSRPILNKVADLLELEKKDLNLMLHRKVIEFLDQNLPKLSDKEPTPGEKRHFAITYLEKNVEVEADSSTNLIQVTAEAKEPMLAADIANTLTRLYIEKELELQKAPHEEKDLFINQQIEIAKKELQGAEDAVREFLKKEDISAFEEELRENTNKLASFKAEYINTNLRLKEVKAMVSNKEPDINRITAVLPEAKGDVYISSLKGKLASLEAEQAELLSKYTPENDLIVRLEQEIKEVKDKLNKECLRILNTVIEHLEAKEASLLLIVSDYEDKLRNIKERQLSFERISENVTHKRQAYFSLMTKEEELRISASMQESEIPGLKNIRIISWAERPHKPIRPKTMLNLLLAVLVGSLGGVGGALLIDAWDTTVKDSRGIKKYVGVDLVGSVPMLRRRLLGIRSFPPHQSFKNLWVNLSFYVHKENIHSILIAGLHREGKTTVAMNLALAITAVGDKKVLLIDANLRNPAIHKQLNLKHNFGLSDVLLGKKDLRSCLHSTNLRNFFVLPSGEGSPDDPINLLESQRMDKLLIALKSHFDIVIFDSPALGKYLDGLVLGSKVDATLLLVEALKTKHHAASYIREILNKAGARIFGVVLNKRRYFIPAFLYKTL
ncbi:MAG: polysaccharide biosynthesis tyrosine autokinase [Candidatus Omnitrophica bacterium]|nr:polysaccharide biosynthesis tyrosine autokinase [Candidatus Omnitrophota bacterium]